MSNLQESFGTRPKLTFDSPRANAFLRVVLEKPFGSDSASATAMAAELRAHLNDDEIFRIDHYLGKAAVRNVAQFRCAAIITRSSMNPRLSPSILCCDSTKRIDGNVD